MGNVTNIGDRRPTIPINPLDGPALRSIACSAAWTETDPAEARRWLGPSIVAALPAALAEADAKLRPATLADAKSTLLPALALVAPVGMTEGDRMEWIAAALGTLSGIPADLLERGSLEARRIADHPSKIVPAIMAEVRESWERRKRDLANVQRLQALASGAAELRPWERDSANEGPADICTPEQAAAIRAEFGLGCSDLAERRAPAGPLRTPTLADYLELGVPREVAERFFAEQAEKRRPGAPANSSDSAADAAGHF